MSAVPDDAIVIAVDGGGTKTDAVALDLDGNLLSHARRAGSSAMPDDLDRSVAVVDEAITGVQRATGGRPVAQTNIYLAGLDVPAEVSAFEERVAAKGWARGATGRPVGVYNDMFAVLRAGSSSPNAVAVVCGTGINCIGVRDDGTHARFVSWGRISGDWGGGAALGGEALWFAARDADGRGEHTSLTVMVADHFGLRDVSALIEALHFNRIPVQRLSELAPLVFRAATAGDSVARRIVERQAEEIATMATSVLTRLRLLDTPVPIVLGGGIIAAGNDLLLSGIAACLAVRAPRATTEVVHSRPIMGAAFLTLEAIGASPTVIETARAALERIA